MDDHSMNKVILVGRLGRDPEVNYTKDGTAIATLSLATSEKWKNKSGDRQEKTEWHRVVVFKGTAEFAKDYLRKGTMISVDGKLRTRQWEDKNGDKRYTTEVVARRVTILSSKEDSQQSPDIPFDEKKKEESDSDENIPF